MSTITGRQLFFLTQIYCKQAWQEEMRILPQLRFLTNQQIDYVRQGRWGYDFSTHKFTIENSGIPDIQKVVEDVRATLLEEIVDSIAEEAQKYIKYFNRELLLNFLLEKANKEACDELASPTLVSVFLKLRNGKFLSDKDKVAKRTRRVENTIKNLNSTLQLTNQLGREKLKNIILEENIRSSDADFQKLLDSITSDKFEYGMILNRKKFWTSKLKEAPSDESFKIFLKKLGQLLKELAEVHNKKENLRFAWEQQAYSKHPLTNPTPPKEITNQLCEAFFHCL